MAANIEMDNLSISKLVEPFRCCVCLEFARPGQRLRCCTVNGHFTCDNCYASLKKQREEPNCPVCREGKFRESARFATLLAFFDIAKNFISYECEGSAWGCSAKLSAKTLVEHETVCEKRLSVCPGSGCNFKAPFENFALHGSSSNEGKFPHPCFNQAKELNNKDHFFVWNIELDGETMIDVESRRFVGDRKKIIHKPILLSSQNPSLRACVVTAPSVDHRCFTASILWLEPDYALEKRKEKRIFKVYLFSCGCSTMLFKGEPIFQNWDTDKVDSSCRQLCVHFVTFYAMLHTCILCNAKDCKISICIELVSTHN